jgi:hypothetical protein
MELESNWNSCVKCKQEKQNHKKLKDKIITWTMNPPHFLTRKCQKLNQLPSSWTPTLEVALTRTTNNELEHIDYRPSQGIFRPCTSGKKRCVDPEIQVRLVV